MTGSATAGVIAVTAAVVVVLLALRVAPLVLAPVRSITGPAAGRARRRSRHRWPGAVVGRSRPHAPDDTEVAAWCRRVAAGVRSGSSLTGAVVGADEPGSPFRDVGHAVRRGRPLAAVLRATPGDPATAVGLAVPVLATCAELGGPAAGAIEQLAAVLDARASARAERAAASAQATLSARVLTLVPIGVVVLLAVVEPSVRRATTTPVGATCIAAGVALDLCGWWWMHRMIRGRP